MALTYGFYNSNNGDRRYTAEQMSAIFNYLITEGVLSSYGNHFAVIPGVGMRVLVKSGWAWYESTWTQNDADMPLSLSPSDPVSGRIDAIVLETNHNISSRANRIKVVEGTYSSFPQKPALTSSANVNEHALAYVKVNAGATNITTIDIEIVVGKEETPFITSVLQSTSIDVLFNQWEGEFDAWFEHIQEVLSEEVVTNLYAEIDKRVKIADKASEAEAKAGTNDTHWMTPAKVRVAVEENVRDSNYIFTKVNTKSLYLSDVINIKYNAQRKFLVADLSLPNNANKNIYQGFLIQYIPNSDSYYYIMSSLDANTRGDTDIFITRYKKGTDEYSGYHKQMFIDGVHSDYNTLYSFVSQRCRFFTIKNELYVLITIGNNNSNKFLYNYYYLLKINFDNTYSQLWSSSSFANTSYLCELCVYDNDATIIFCASTDTSYTTIKYIKISNLTLKTINPYSKLSNIKTFRFGANSSDIFLLEYSSDIIRLSRTNGSMNLSVYDTKNISHTIIASSINTKNYKAILKLYDRVWIINLLTASLAEIPISINNQIPTLNSISIMRQSDICVIYLSSSMEILLIIDLKNNSYKYMNGFIGPIRSGKDTHTIMCIDDIFVSSTAYDDDAFPSFILGRFTFDTPVSIYGSTISYVRSGNIAGSPSVIIYGYDSSNKHIHMVGGYHRRTIYIGETATSYRTYYLVNTISLEKRPYGLLAIE